MRVRASARVCVRESVCVKGHETGRCVLLCVRGLLLISRRVVGVGGVRREAERWRGREMEREGGRERERGREKESKSE